MATTPTNKPIPSEDPRDLKFNAGKIDEVVTGNNHYYTDRFGVRRWTIAGFQYTAEEAIRNYGYITMDSFEGGATLTLPNQVLRYKATGEYYRWDGDFPKDIPENSNPGNAGGVGLGAWVSVGDASLRSDLSTDGGASLSGYKNPKSLVSETVKLALDKINIRIIFAEDFGVKTDSSDNAEALWALGQYLSSSTEPLYVVFPSGVSLVGSQQLAGASGLGYSYRPSYQSRSWSDPSAMGWFSVAQTNQKIILDMSGWTLKLNDGLKVGAYDPVTGNPASDVVSETPDANYLASTGYLIKIYLAPNVEIKNGTTDGNLVNLQWGGKYGNTGYQVPAYNMWVNQSEGFR